MLQSTWCLSLGDFHPLHLYDLCRRHLPSLAASSPWPRVAVGAIRTMGPWMGLLLGDLQMARQTGMILGIIWEKMGSGWWLEPLWKILVNWDDDIPNSHGKIKNGNQTTNQLILFPLCTRFLKIIGPGSSFSLEKPGHPWTSDGRRSVAFPCA